MEIDSHQAKKCVQYCVFECVGDVRVDFVSQLISTTLSKCVTQYLALEPNSPTKIQLMFHTFRTRVRRAYLSQTRALKESGSQILAMMRLQALTFQML